MFGGSRALVELLAAGARAVESTPLTDRSGALIGVLSTYFEAPHRPDNRELKLVGFLARKATAFIERDEMSTKLSLMELQLEKITDNVASPITQCSHDLRYVFVNKAYARFIGRPASKIVGRPIREVIGRTAFDTILPHMKRVLTGERVEYEAEIAFPGVGPREMQVVYVPDIESGEVRGWFAGMTDITDLRLEQRHKNELISMFAHELRNPLATIGNCVEILKRAGDDPRISKASLDRLDRQLKSLVRLVGDLLDLSWLNESMAGQTVRRSVEKDAKLHLPDGRASGPSATGGGLAIAE